MSKRVRYILFSLAALVLLAAIVAALVFWPQKKGTAGASSSASSSEEYTILGYIKVFEHKSDEIRDISAKNTNGGFDLKYIKKGNWQLLQSKESVVSESSMESLVLSCTEFAATKVIAENPDDMSPYGLDKPCASASVSYSTGETLTVSIGNDNSDGYTYVYLKENNKIYLTESSWASAFKQAYSAFIDLTLLDGLKTDSEGNEIDIDVKKITYRGRALEKPIIIEENPIYVEQEKALKNSSSTSESTIYASHYLFKSPIEADISNDAFDGMEYHYFGLTAFDVYSMSQTSQALSECGLADPYVSIEIVSERGTETIRLGNKITVDDKQYYYATATGKKPIFIVPANDYSFFEEKPIDYMSAIVVNVMIDDIKTMTVETDGKKYTFEESGTDEALVVRWNGKKMSTTEYRDLYQLVMMLYCEEAVEAGQYKGTADLKISYTYRNTSKTDTVEYIKAGTRKYMIRRNGSDLALVRSKYVDALKNGIAQFIAGKDVPSAY